MLIFQNVRSSLFLLLFSSDFHFSVGKKCTLSFKSGFNFGVDFPFKIKNVHVVDSFLETA